jgi:hypothetical protein
MRLQSDLSIDCTILHTSVLPHSAEAGVSVVCHRLRVWLHALGLRQSRRRTRMLVYGRKSRVSLYQSMPISTCSQCVPWNYVYDTLRNQLLVTAKHA